MKKKEIDLFGILLGLVIGCVLGYFVFSRSLSIQNDSSNPVINDQVYGTVYTVSIGSRLEEDHGLLEERLNILNLHYEIFEENNKKYYLNSIYDNIESATMQKEMLEGYGFIVSIRSDYIIDLSKEVINDTVLYNFYNEAIINLLNSLSNKEIIISEEYYVNPVDIEILSNLTILSNIKNQEFKNNYELNTFCLLLKKLK